MPGVNVWTWTLTKSSSWTTTRLLPWAFKTLVNLFLLNAFFVSFGPKRKINSVQYPNSLSSSSALTWAFPFLSTTSASFLSIKSPWIIDSIPSRILTSPAPPLSTTPTSFKTGKRLGVLSKLSFASWSKILKASSIELKVLIFFFKFSLDSLITVKIVPSTGLITAL